MPQEQRRHSYQRKFDPEGDDSLAKLGRLIAPGTRVLDVGCGPGVLGSYLARDKGCTVDGIEFNHVDAQEARKTFRQVLENNLEGPDPLGAFMHERYDYVVCADVLEHLREPGTLLDQLVPLLRPTGRMLISIPNIAYSGLIAELIEGQFRYKTEGILDTTHLRFYTRSSLLEWLPRHGLAPISIDTVEMPFEHSEFKVGLESFPPQLLSALLSRPDSSTIQFIVEAIASSSPQPLVVSPATSCVLGFLCQLYLGDREGVNEANSVRGFARLAVERQRVELRIPPQTIEVAQLRFDITNRPGLVHLFDLVLRDSTGDCLWKWDGTPSLLDRSSGCQEVPSEEGLTILCNDDPHIDLPVAAGGMARLARGGTLTVELSWPASPDGAAVAKRFFGPEEQLKRIVELSAEAGKTRAERDDARRRIAELEAELTGVRAQRDGLQAALDAVNDSAMFKLVNAAKRALGRSHKP